MSYFYVCDECDTEVEADELLDDDDLECEMPGCEGTLELDEEDEDEDYDAEDE
jgi:hypothetical protein